MKLGKRSKALSLFGSVAAAGTLAIGAAPAHADSGSAWYAASLCGSGYRPLDSFNVGDSGRSTSSTYLSYNGGWDCVVTLKDIHVGTPTWTDATIGTDENNMNFDADNYSYYAGPVYAYAPGTCIWWGGGDADTGVYVEGPNHCN
ncbi:MAG TPA: hypothetical protein VFU74_20075 [Actinocrinis sp.]|nr:hypothetical protein [Actinocrinis sp.]